MSGAKPAHKELGTLWEFGSETVRLDKAGLGHLFFAGGGRGYISRALWVSLVAFPRGRVMVWIVPLVAGSHIPRHVLVVFEKRKRFQHSLSNCSIVADVHCDPTSRWRLFAGKNEHRRPFPPCAPPTHLAATISSEREILRSSKKKGATSSQ